MDEGQRDLCRKQKYMEMYRTLPELVKKINMDRAAFCKSLE